MDQIFDFLFSNPLLAFLIIGALFSFFKGGSNSAEEQKKKQAEQQRRQNEQRQSQTQRPQQQRRHERQPSTSRTATTESRTSRVEQSSAPEETNKRKSPLRDLKETIEREISKVLDERPERPKELEVSMPISAKRESEERLTIQKDQEMNYDDRGFEANILREREVKNLVSQYNHTKFKKTFLTSLDKEGLINSVIMAEVLGKPRAQNPYRPPTHRN